MSSLAQTVGKPTHGGAWIDGAGGLPLPRVLHPGASPVEPASACVRPSCWAIKRHAVRLAQDVEALTLERDALRAALDERVGCADWTPIGGERVMRALTATEGRLCEALLLAGRERRPDDAPDAAPSGEFLTARHAWILRHAWGPEWGLGDGERHLIRVNASRLRRKLRPFGWDVVSVFNRGLRLVPWTREGAPPPPGRFGRHHRRIADGERAQIVQLWEAGFRAAVIEAVTGRSPDTIRRVLRDARLHGGAAEPARAE